MWCITISDAAQYKCCSYKAIDKCKWGNIHTTTKWAFVVAPWECLTYAIIQLMKIIVYMYLILLLPFCSDRFRPYLIGLTHILYGSSQTFWREKRDGHTPYFPSRLNQKGANIQKKKERTRKKNNNPNRSHDDIYTSVWP